VSACGFKPVLRDARDAGRALCEMFAVEQADAAGISPREAFELYCATDEALAPWDEEALRAKQAAGTAALQQEKSEP